MFFEVLLGGLTHADKFFAQAERKVLGRDIHQNGVLRHFKFRLTGVHIFLGCVISRINLETGKDRPHNGQACVKEPVVLHLHVVVGVLCGRTILFRSLHGGVIDILAIDDSTPDIGRFGIHISLGGLFVHAGGNSL